MSEEERFKLENELLMTKSKAQMINLYLDKLDQLQQKENIIKEVREKVDNFDVFKEFTFPLMKRDEEQQVKSSIDYEWRKSIKEPILEILDKVEKENDIEFDVLKALNTDLDDDVEMG